MQRVYTGQRLAALRKLMQNVELVPTKLHAYIVPSEDAHHSEYTAPCDMRRAFITGFTGSRGTAVVTLNSAALWTVGIYHLQAMKQLDDNWTLMRQNTPGVPTIAEWLCNVLVEGNAVGVDPHLCSKGLFEKLANDLGASGITLIAVGTNLIDCVWGTSRPARKNAELFIHELMYAGMRWQEKIEIVKEKMKENDAQLLFIPSLAEIAWLFNLRGTDIPCNFHFFAYAIIGESSSSLFIDEKQLSMKLEEHLSDVNVKIVLQPYSSARDYFALMTQCQGVKRVWMPPDTSYAFTSAVPKEMHFIHASPILQLKAIKNSVEVAGSVEAHIRDSVAHCLFLSWLKEEIMDRRGQVSEVSAVEKFDEFRRLQELYLGPSFPSISAAGSNAAMIHYKPTSESNRLLSRNELYLIDSGGHYYDGTTDVTRTVMFEQATDLQKECFTRVVKGHIALAKQIFPDDCPGYLLDALSRQHLWEVGLDYQHGTGHGVGMLSTVHEGPIGFGSTVREGVNSDGLHENMIVTIEPGYYRDEEFGMRLENVYVVQSAQKPNELKPSYAIASIQSNKYLRFEPLTLVPIQMSLLMMNLLTDEECEWIDRYHARCRDVVGERLMKLGYSDAFRWLINETAPIR